VDTAQGEGGEGLQEEMTQRSPVEGSEAQSHTEPRPIILDDNTQVKHEWFS